MTKKLSDYKYWEFFYSKRNIKRYSKKKFGMVKTHLLKIFAENLPKEKMDFIEFGCGGSGWILYFAKEFGYNISGIDYSDKGIDLVSKWLELEKIEAKIYKFDFFNLPEKFINAYNIGASFGVIEHFENPSEVLKLFNNTLKKEGILITGIPKLIGFSGFLQRFAHKSILSKHVRYNLNRYIIEHEKAGFDVIYSKEIGLSTLGLNFGNKKKHYFFYRVYSRFLNTLLKHFVPLNMVNKLKIGSYYVIISKKAVFKKISN